MFSIAEQFPCLLLYAALDLLAAAFDPALSTMSCSFKILRYRHAGATIS